MDLMERYPDIVDYDGFEVGDCTFHHGWCLHRYVHEENVKCIPFSILKDSLLMQF